MNLIPFASILAAEAATNIREEQATLHYLSQPLKEVSAEVYDDMLGCVPPILWVGIDHGSRFCVSEMQEGSITSSFAKYKGKYYHKYVDITKPKTFITPEMIEAFTL